jgi:putative transposase
MTWARREIVDHKEVGTYHCISRCVRRAFLCGKDRLSGKSFEHRRAWIRSRLRSLTEVFAIEVIAYAILSNHLHSLLRNRPDLAKGWSDEEVARRWRTLFPLRRINGVAAKPNREEILAIVAQPKKVALYRERLSNISWFNRCLNENIARRANHEDDCKGRFWEGRFKCQRVFDIAGILACSTYIDLNPIRAGSASTLEESDHTSIQDRIVARTKKSPKRDEKWAIIPLVSIADITEHSVTLDEYIKIVDETGRLIIEGKASLSPELRPVLERLNIAPEHWVETTREFKHKFRRVVGSARCIKEAARTVKKKWFQGMSSARLIFREGQVTASIA